MKSVFICSASNLVSEDKSGICDSDLPSDHKMDHEIREISGCGAALICVSHSTKLVVGRTGNVACNICLCSGSCFSSSAQFFHVPQICFHRSQVDINMGSVLSVCVGNPELPISGLGIV